MRDIPATLTASPQRRALLVDRSTIDETSRTVHLAFASEEPVRRAFGNEVLECSAKSMRPGRLARGANLLCEHDPRDVLGVVESIDIGADKVARAVVRFGRSARAQEVFADVVDGIRRNVSVGYLVHGAKLDGQTDGVDTYRITDWEPFELSVVSVPADITVGVGRSTAATPDDPAPLPDAPKPDPLPPTPETSTMSEIITVVEKRDHASEISKLAASIPGGADLALRSIQAGHTVEQFQAEALRALATKPLPTADIGMTDKEVRSYSVVRAINALANPTDVAAQRAAGFERETSDAVASKMGKASRGFYVPYDVQRGGGQVGQRDLTAGTNNAGGYTVATDLLAGSFIEALRNAMVVMGLGTRMLTGLQGNIAIPKMSSGATAYWVAENAAPTESQQTLAQVTLTPKTVGAFTDISRRLLVQSSVDVENMVRADLATVLGLAIQQGAISGSGASNQPSGLLTLITASVVGGTNGLAPTWANIIKLETDVAVGNADVGSMAYLTNAKVRGKLKGVEQFATTNGMPVWREGSTPLNGYRAGVTNAVPSNLTKGTSSGVCSAIIFGNFSDLLIGMWGGLDLMADPYTGSTAGTVRVVALQDVDVAVRNVESFATMVDALTT